jgi:pimeloyl-ACP methyl ester carboxylesterase
MPTFDTVMVDTDTGPLGVHVFGECGIPVICWPTLMGDHRSMSEMAFVLAYEYGLQVAVIDPPGFAYSQSIRQWPGLSGCVGMALAVANELAAARFHWVGHGFGGHVGAVLASRLPHRVASITMISTPLIQPARFSGLSRLLAPLLWHTETGRSKITRHMLSQVDEPLQFDHDLIAHRLRMTFEDGNLQVLRTLAPTPPRMLTQLRAMLQRSETPKLIVAGRHDKMALVREQRTIGELLPHARFAQLDCSFMVPMVRPRELAIEVAAFVKSLG